MKAEGLAQSLNEKMNGRSVYFLWSGGDDSNLLLRTVLETGANKTCTLTIVTIPFPQHAYLEEKIADCSSFFSRNNMEFQVLRPEFRMPEDVPYAKACITCKTVRRTAFLRFYESRMKANDLIITGHNLSDLMSYYVELCISKLKGNRDFLNEDRYLEVTNKFLSSYQAEFGVEIYRPMLDFSQEEIHSLLSNSPINEFPLKIMSQKCYWTNQRKRLLQDYFQKASVHSDYDTVADLLDKDFGIPSTEDFQKLPFETYLM